MKSLIEVENLRDKKVSRHIEHSSEKIFETDSSVSDDVNPVSIASDYMRRHDM